MRKTVVLTIMCFFLACSDRIEDKNIKDCGQKEIGHNLYIKKVMIGDDRIYFLINENGEVVSGTSTSYTITRRSGNTTTTETKSNSSIFYSEEPSK